MRAVNRMAGELEPRAPRDERAEDAITARQGDLTPIINAIPALVWSAGPDGSTDFLNQHYLDYVGLSAEQVPGAGWTTAVHPDDMAGLLASWHAMMASGTAGEIEARLRRSDGEYRWFLIRTNPLRDGDGNIVRWYGINTDIDDRRKSEEDRELAEAQLAVEKQLLEMVASGSSLRDVLNALCKSVEQLSPDCYCGVYPIDWSGPTFHAGVAPSLPASYTDPIEGWPVSRDLVPCGIAAFEKVQVIMADIEADPRWPAYRTHLATHGLRSVWSTPICSVQGRRVLGTFCIYQPNPATPSPHQQQLISHMTHIASIAIDRAQDLTRQRLADEALDSARSELAHVTRVMSLGTITASIAHEVNQPLSGIITNAGTCLRMLASDPPNVDGARETARRTIRDGHRASEVITHLRALFANRNGALESMDLNEAMREVIVLSSSQLQRSRVSVRQELADDLPPVIGDRIQLQQVVLNLIVNAAEAMSGVDDRPRELLVKTVATEDDHVLVTVRDTGVGLASQDLEKLFVAFYTTKSSGMGIGLSVSRSIIENHHGRLWATPNDGPGATFSFSIPRTHEDPMHRDDRGFAQGLNR